MDKQTENNPITRNEQIDTLLKEQKLDDAHKLIDQFFEEEPDNMDAQAWKAMYRKDNDGLSLFISIFEKDINYDGPPSSRSRHDWNARISFLYALRMKFLSIDIDDEDEQQKEEQRLATLYVSFTEKFLAARRSIPSIQDFADALLIVKRYDDVIRLAGFLSGDIKSEDLGWSSLEWSKDYRKDENGEIISLAIQAFFRSGRYADGCRWIHKQLRNTKLDTESRDYIWYLLGETLCWMGYPEEAVRAWIISLGNGHSYLEPSEDFDTICEMIPEPEEEKDAKEDLQHRLYLAKQFVAPEKMMLFDEIFSQVIMTFGDRLPSVEFIESKLGVELPQIPKKSTRLSRHSSLLFVSRKRINDPVIKEVIETIDNEIGQKSTTMRKAAAAKKQEKVKVTIGGPSSVSSAESTLDTFGVNLTEQVSDGSMPPVVGRDGEIDRMIRILSRAEKNNPVLLGEAGVGKTAIVQGLAQRIVRGNVPDTLKNKMIIELNVAVLVAGTTYRGDFEKRMEGIIKETAQNPDIILFIDEVHTLMGSGGKKHGLDGSNILKPALAAGDLRLIGATTPGEFSRSIEKDPAMERRFSPIWLSEIDRTTTRAVLDARRQHWENHHKVVIDAAVFDAAIQLTDQHVRHRHFPDKAIDAVDEACALVRTLGDSSCDSSTSVVTRDHVARVIQEWSGAETEHADGTGLSVVVKNRQVLSSVVVGQDHIKERLARTAVEIKLGLRLSALPRVYLFTGASHSGKTESARALAQLLWPDERDRFLFINMACHSGEEDLKRLTGVARGYAGSDSSGLLQLHCRQHPHSIVYLYHFADAHPAIQRFFGNLFSQGSFPDPDGRQVYVGSTIFILSIPSNEKSTTFGFGARNAEPDKDKRDRQISEFLKSREVPDSVINSISESLRFDEPGEELVRELIERKLASIMEQPGIRDFYPSIDPQLVDKLVSEFTSTPPESRDLPSLLNREAYGAVVRTVGAL